MLITPPPPTPHPLPKPPVEASEAFSVLSPEETDRLGVSETGVPGDAGGQSELVHFPRGCPQLGHVREVDHARLGESSTGAKQGGGVLSVPPSSSCSVPSELSCWKKYNTTITPY